jgi:hypothetical protein
VQFDEGKLCGAANSHEEIELAPLGANKRPALGLARSNIAERVKGTRPKRGPQNRAGDLELHRYLPPRRRAATYEYRRIAGSSNASGDLTVPG